VILIRSMPDGRCKQEDAMAARKTWRHLRAPLRDICGFDAAFFADGLGVSDLYRDSYADYFGRGGMAARFQRRAWTACGRAAAGRRLAGSTALAPGSEVDALAPDSTQDWRSSSRYTTRPPSFE
jgi:hypothetical protein